MNKLVQIETELNKRGVIYSHVCSPFIHLTNGYIRILRRSSVDIISGGSVFYMDYTELSDTVLQKIINNLKQ